MSAPFLLQILGKVWIAVVQKGKSICFDNIRYYVDYVHIFDKNMSEMCCHFYVYVLYYFL